MKNWGRRILSLLLVCCLSFPFQTGAWERERSVEKPSADGGIQTPYEVTGQNAVGSLLADFIEQEQGYELQAADNGITGMEIADMVADVTYHCAVPARLVASVYDEDSGQLRASGVTALGAGQGTARVNLRGDLPEYYSAKAFLLDPETGVPLCEAYSSVLHTRSMDEVVAATIYDFDENQVLNLDNNPSNNFLVFSDNVTQLTVESGVNTVRSSGGVITIENAGADALALKVGDVFSCVDEEEALLIVKVASIQISGHTVTLTEDESLDLEGAFRLVKIDTDEADNSGTSSLMEAGEFEYSPSASISVNLPMFESKDGGVKGSASGTLEIEVHLKLYFYSGGTEFEISLSDSFEGSISVEGRMKADIPLGGRHSMMPVPGVVVSITPSFLFEASGELEMEIEVSQTIGKGFRTGEGWRSLTTRPEVSKFELDLEGKVFIGFSLEPKVNILYSEKMWGKDGAGLFSASLTMKAGVECDLSKTLWEGREGDDTQRHDCTLCFDGTARFKGDVSGKLKSSLKVLSAEFRAGDVEVELGSIYLSLYQGKMSFGFGECPHISHRVTVECRDSKNGAPLSGVSVRLLDEDTNQEAAEAVTSDQQGNAICYLRNGRYRASGSYQSSGREMVAESPFVVLGGVETVTILLDTGRAVSMYKVSVQVTDEEGNPVSGAQIQGTSSTSPVFTDARGIALYYAVNGLESIQVAHEESDAEGTLQFQVDGQDCSVTVVIHPRRYLLRIYVSDGAGNRIEEARVQSTDLGIDMTTAVLGVADMMVPTGTHTFLVTKGDLSREVTVTVNRAETTARVVLASVVGDEIVTSLGTSAMANPIPEGGGWSYVYYGKYDGTEPTKYRVLDKAATEFGGRTMLLDCDSTLYCAAFDGESPYTKVWADSTVRAGLNGDAFLTKEGNFTAVEAAAIAESVKGSKAEGDGDRVSWVSYAPLTGEKIFLLDEVEATRPSYGYPNSYESTSFRMKTGTTGTDSWWWLRSPSSHYVTYAGNVDSYGFLNLSSHVIISSVGVSPAFNVNLSSVLFSSLISGSDGVAGAEYKLTLQDGDLSIAVTGGQNVLRSGASVRVPYTVTDHSETSTPTRISVLVTDKEYTENGASILQYESLSSTGGVESNGVGTFTLNSSITGTWGTDYHVYILAEDINGEYETDYASEPVELSAPVSGRV